MVYTSTDFWWISKILAAAKLALMTGLMNISRESRLQSKEPLGSSRFDVSSSAFKREERHCMGIGVNGCIRLKQI